MRIVLDTNVVVSGLLNEAGVPAQVLDLCIARTIDLVVDARIVAEHEEVLRRPELDLDPGGISECLAVLRYAEHVVGVPLPLTFRDPADLAFIEVAVASGADAIVTGNARHFRPHEGKLDVAVLTPKQLLDRVATGA